MDHEEATVKAFFAPTKRRRSLDMLSNPKRRARFTQELVHFKSLDPRYVLAIPPNQQNPSSLRKLLSSMGAGDKGWVISENSDLDAQEMDLEIALRETVGYGMGTIISCIPGRLAYFEDENVRYILRR